MDMIFKDEYTDVRIRPIDKCDLDTHDMLDLYIRGMLALSYQIESIHDAILDKADEIETIRENKEKSDDKE